MFSVSIRSILRFSKQNLTVYVKRYHWKVMAGDHDKCSVLRCGSCRRTKGIGIWKLLLQRTRLPESGKKIGSRNLQNRELSMPNEKKK